MNLRDARVLIYNFTYRSYELLFLFHMYAHHSNPRLLSERPLKVAFFCFVLDSLVVDDGVAPSLEPYLAFKDFYWRLAWDGPKGVLSTDIYIEETTLFDPKE